MLELTNWNYRGMYAPRHLKRLHKRIMSTLISHTGRNRPLPRDGGHGRNYGASITCRKAAVIEGHEGWGWWLLLTGFYMIPNLRFCYFTLLFFDPKAFQHLYSNRPGTLVQEERSLQSILFNLQSQLALPYHQPRAKSVKNRHRCPQTISSSGSWQNVVFQE